MKAFPTLADNGHSETQDGMELRDYFAKDFAVSLMEEFHCCHDEPFINSVCTQAYVWADAMMEARNGK